jgi:hypothetical protein
MWVDMRAARLAGMKSIAALWDPLVDLQKLKGEEPSFLARSPSDVLQFLSLVKCKTRQTKRMFACWRGIKLGQ